MRLLSDSDRGHSPSSLMASGHFPAWMAVTVPAQARARTSASSFRTEFAYTNFGYSEAAHATALARGESWENLASKKLFIPLGMKNPAACKAHTPSAS